MHGDCIGPASLHVQQTLSAWNGLCADTRYIPTALFRSYSRTEHMCCGTEGMALEIQYCIAAVPDFACDSTLPAAGMSRDGQVGPSPGWCMKSPSFAQNCVRWWAAYSHYMPVRTCMQLESRMASPDDAHACKHACRWFCHASGAIHAQIDAVLMHRFLLL